MNLPNRITMGRFALALALFGFLEFSDVANSAEWWKPALAGAVFILAVATDALDGYYARKLGLQTDFGRIADPVVDKVIVCGVLVFFCSYPWAEATVPTWMVALIICREFMVSGLRGFIEARGVAFPARWDGKLKMVLQCAMIPAVFLERVMDLRWPGEETLVMLVGYLALSLVWLTFVLTLSSGARYVMAAATVLRSQGEQRSAQEGGS
jgi:CDP-diacylglycerol--glycerol-3-phosphate 3-phosphatidyltransferase